jgi:hypothetical protein
MDIRPQDLPELRAELAASLMAPSMLDFYEGRARGHVYRGAQAAKLQQLESQGLAQADLYFIAQPMAELALEAAKTLPPYEIQPADLPSPNGFAYLGDGAFQATEVTQPAAAFSWRDTGTAVAFHLYASTAPMLERLLALGACTRQQADTHRAVAGRLSPMAFEAEIVYNLAAEEINDSEGDQHLLVSAFRSMWLLMQQPLTSATEADVDRATRKRLQRAGEEPSTVRVIEIRRPRRSDAGEGESGREYFHQWVVKGHWRQQWYPAREVHRPV